MNIFCKICKKKIKTSMLEHMQKEHADYEWPSDWSKDGDQDE